MSRELPNFENESPFHDLMIRYGKLVEEKMRSASSREEAEQFTEETWRAFNHQCGIEDIREKFREYLFEIFTKYWDKMMIRKEILMEELVREHPESVRFLMEKGIKCIACGEPIWGTLEEAAKEKGFSGQEIDTIVSELNDLLSEKTSISN